MKKLLGILVISLLWCGASFAMSSTYEKTYYDICYPQIKKLSNPTRAKQYCTCTMKMMSKRYSDKAMDKMPQKSYAERAKLTQFAADHCNDNANAFQEALKVVELLYEKASRDLGYQCVEFAL